MASSRRQYPFHLIEPKWQILWDKQQTFRAWNPGESLPAEHPFGVRHGLSGKVSAAQLPPKFYILDMFPYPSGAGLHVGHPEGYTATDILARYQRACGFNVLHPMGWDAFGLPAEQYAVKTGQHPRQTTEQNIATFKRQIQSLGFSYDWSRELATTDPDYFKWTQWIFLKLYNSWFNPETNRAEPIEILEDVLSENPKREWTKGEYGEYVSGLRNGYVFTPAEQRAQFRREQIDKHRLAFVTDAPVWWCEALGTVLANEEVVDGKSEVGGHEVRKKMMRQWMLRISAYAERLIADLDTIDWSDSLKQMQINWIGRSEGATVKFQIDVSKTLPHVSKYTIDVFTTRPDTLFGATYMVVAPEHRTVDDITPSDCRAAVEAYRAEVGKKSDLERTELAKEKTGVFTGAYAINPVNGEKIPIWIADYVLASYGTGAIMAVPAHDERDFEFASRFGLQVRRVVEPTDEWIKANYNPLHNLGIKISEVRCINLDDEGQRNSLARRVAEVTGSELDFCEECVRLLQRVTCKGEATQEELDSLRECYVTSPWCFIQERSAYVSEGLSIDSANDEISLSGLPTAEAKKKITDWLEEKGLGKRTINYKLRDWLFSRQRYWGEPFPIVWKRDAGGNLYHEALPESALPLLPPSLTDYKPTATGEPPLARAKDWVNLPDGSTRETNTMPQWAGSCWYYLRYLDAKNSSAFVGKDAENYWMGSNGKSSGVDLYVGGTEHAVLHLLYARFWHKVLFDLGYVSTPEPFHKLVNQGMVLGEDNQKMSKSRGNVIPVDVPVAEVGTDALRLYEMFMGPLEMVKPWSTKGVEGVYRFLGRVWRMFVDEQSETEFEQAETTAEAPRRGELLELIQLSSAIKNVSPTPAQLKTLHACIKKVTEDLDGMRFNTAISAMMIFVNDAMAWETKPVSVLRTFLQLLAPFAPHLAEELWAKLSAKSQLPSASLPYAPWPKFDPALLVESEIEIPVSVNGKMRDVIKVSADADNATLETAAKASEKVKSFLAGKTIKKVIVVPKKMVNLIVG